MAKICQPPYMGIIAIAGMSSALSRSFPRHQNQDVPPSVLFIVVEGASQTSCFHRCCTLLTKVTCLHHFLERGVADSHLHVYILLPGCWSCVPRTKQQVGTFVPFREWYAMRTITERVNIQLLLAGLYGKSCLSTV
jgi:hypothetical protein